MAAMIDARMADVLAAAWPVLLDFDGPVTHLFVNGRNRMVADRMRQALPRDWEPPLHVWETYDPLVALRWTASHTPASVQQAVDVASIQGRGRSSQTHEPTADSLAFLEACRAVGRPLVIISSNAEEAIHAYLDRFDLHHLITARTPGRPDLMKPHPTHSTAPWLS